MRYRFSIPLMLTISILSGVLSWELDFNVMGAVTVSTAVLFACDSWLLHVRRFRGTMAQPPAAVAIVTLLVWPLAFPMYLSLRRKVVTGTAPLRTKADDRLSPGWAVAVVVFGGLQIWALWVLVPLIRELRELQTIAAHTAMTAVAVSEAHHEVTVTLPAQIASDSLTQWLVAENVARNLLSDSRRDAKLEAIAVQYVLAERHGSTVTSTSVVTRFDWTRREILSLPGSRTKGSFTLDFDEFPTMPSDCRATGDFDVWTAAAEMTGYGAGTLECAGETDARAREVYLRLGQGDEERVGLLEVGLAPAPGHPSPCIRFEACTCPILFAHPAFSLTLNCRFGPSTAYISLDFRPEDPDL